MSSDTVLIWQVAPGLPRVRLLVLVILWDLCFTVIPLPSLPHCLCISSVSLGVMILSVICWLSLSCVALDLLFSEGVCLDFTYFRLLWNRVLHCCQPLILLKLCPCWVGSLPSSQFHVVNSFWVFFPDWKTKVFFFSSEYMRKAHLHTPSIVGKSSLTCSMCTCYTLHSNNATSFPSSPQPPTACRENREELRQEDKKLFKMFRSVQSSNARTIWQKHSEYKPLRQALNSHEIHWAILFFWTGYSFLGAGSEYQYYIN